MQRTASDDQAVPLRYGVRLCQSTRWKHEERSFSFNVNTI